MTVAELHQKLENLHADSFGWALHCCHGQQTLAEDVLQTAYLKVLEQRAVFKGKSTFRTWLFSVIRFTAIDAARYQQSKRKREEALQIELERAMQQPATEVAQELEVALFKQALAQLSPRQQEVMQLVFYHNLTIAEASEIMGVGLGSARKHYQRGKAALKKQLAERNLIKQAP